MASVLLRRLLTGSGLDATHVELVHRRTARAGSLIPAVGIDGETETKWRIPGEDRTRRCRHNADKGAGPAAVGAARAGTTRTPNERRHVS